MRKQFVACDTRKEAKAECPWATYIAQVFGGFMCFESRDDYITWRWQK